MPSGKAFVCSLDGRSFKTRAALRQHARDAHKPASRAPSGGLRRPRMALTGSSVIRTSGSDELGTFMVSPYQQVGRLLAYIPIGPETIQHSRFQLEGKLYQRWRPVSMRLRYIGAGPMTAGGSFALAWTPDATNQVTVENPGLSFALSSERNALVRMDSNAALTIPSAAAFKWYQTDAVGPVGHHGAVVAVLASPPSGVRSSVAVTVVIDWVVEWQGRKLELASMQPGQKIKPDTGYTNLFTTSDGSFDSTILTLKAHAGGGMVPFSSAMPGVVYKPSGSTKVPYYKDKNSTDSAEWFSLVIGYEVKGLVLHTSESEAREYQRTGDKTHCIHYVAAGGWATPAVLEFEAVAHVSEPPPEQPSVSSLLDRISKLEAALENFQVFREESEPS